MPLNCIENYSRSQVWFSSNPLKLMYIIELGIDTSPKATSVCHKVLSRNSDFTNISVG